jgi:hypothetical protein
MLESEADRLAEVQALGSGATLKAANGCFWVIFDNEFVLSGIVEERSPAARMRSSDALCGNLQKEALVEAYNPFDATRKKYRISRLEDDSTGMTLVVLKAA